MFLSYGLYLCIILEMAHHRTTLEYFAILLKILHLKKISTKVPYFLTNCTFSYGKVKEIFLGIKIKFHLGREKGWSKRWNGRISLKLGLCFAEVPLLSKIQTVSHKLLVR